MQYFQTNAFLSIESFPPSTRKSIDNLGCQLTTTEISSFWPNPGCKLTTLDVNLQPPFLSNVRNKLHGTGHGHTCVHTHVLCKIHLDVNWEPWLSIDNLRSDFEHSEGGNVHTSRDVLACPTKLSLITQPYGPKPILTWVHFPSA